MLLEFSGQFSFQNTEEGLMLYFHYLRQRFFKEDGQLKLSADDGEDFLNYVEARMEEVLKITSYPGITSIEQEGGLRLVEWIKNQLPVRNGPEGSSMKP